MNEILNLSISKLVAFFLVLLCFLSLVDGVMPQLQLFLLGAVPLPEYMVKGLFLAAGLVACLLFRGNQPAGIPRLAWLLCLAYMLVDVAYLTHARAMPLATVLQSYSGYYPLLFIGPILFAFRGSVSQSVMLRLTICAFVVCAAIGIIQYLTARPILFTESTDGAFRVDSWYFFDRVRAFSLFTSAMNFGMFCALCGALGVALSRRFPLRGILLVAISGAACFTTLTRLVYLLFICVCSYAFVLTYGKKSDRGRWQPVFYFLAGIATVVAGLSSLVSGGTNNLQDASSLLQRIGQWTYYADFLIHSPVSDQLFGVGIVQNEKILPLYPMIIDNLPLALILHIGIVGLVLFAILLVQMWLFLRREALEKAQPFTIAAASLWAALACAGIFNIVFASFGTVFALAVLCRRDPDRVVELEG